MERKSEVEAGPGTHSSAQDDHNVIRVFWGSGVAKIVADRHNHPMSADSDTFLHIRDGLMYLVALVLSIGVHEWGHAFVADRLGDRLPRAQGRVTLNPLAHIDPFGTVLFPLIAFVTALSSPGLASRMIGWGRPVQISLRGLRPGWSIKTAHLLIALAGPLMNVMFALVVSSAYYLLVWYGGEPRHELALALASVVTMNVGLAFFNLIPCPPLDGGAVLRGLLPRSLEKVADLLERYGFFIFFALLMTGLLSYFMIPAHRVAHLLIERLTLLALAGK
jgi:Zn-dependent protease